MRELESGVVVSRERPELDGRVYYAPRLRLPQERQKAWVTATGPKTFVS
jgi:hypothetical protein